MGAAGRGLVALAVVVATSCTATEHVMFTKPASYVPWQPLPAAHQRVDAPLKGPVAPLPVPAETPPCSGSQLEGVALAAGVGLGNVDMPVLLRNRSAADCFVDGYPDLTVLDRRGRVIGRSVGSSGRGTYFSEISATPAFMPNGTPPLPSTKIRRGDAPLGQAYVDISWYDSKGPQAATLAIDLPNDGGRVVIPFAETGATSPACQGAQTCMLMLRGPLTAAGVLPVAIPDYQPVAVELNAPAGAKLGTQLTYFVTMTNNGKKAYAMPPCADFTESLDAKQFNATYQLNCEKVGELAPGASVSFEMRYEIPISADKGSRFVCWDLADGRIEMALACAPVLIS